jgi:hypothetical protein
MRINMVRTVLTIKNERHLTALTGWSPSWKRTVFSVRYEPNSYVLNTSIFWVVTEEE